MPFGAMHLNTSSLTYSLFSKLVQISVPSNRSGLKLTTRRPRAFVLKNKNRRPKLMHKATEDVTHSVVHRESEREYYEPKIGDLVAGVIVSSNKRRFQVDIGAESLAILHSDEVSPCESVEYERMLCQWPAKSDAESPSLGPSDDDLFYGGKRGILSIESTSIGKNVKGESSTLEEGTVVFVDVVGRTLSGLCLISSRRVGRRVAWQRVRQLKEVNEPFEIYISEWNTRGLISRIEGLRAFLPKSEMVNAPIHDAAQLKEKVGTKVLITIIRASERSEGLIISERIAWEMKNIYEGNVLQGTITKLFAFGALVQVDGTNISGLVHVSNISRAHVASVSDVFSEGEKVKVMVIRSGYSDKINFSTALLESQEGLILSNKEKVFEEAEQTAQAYRKSIYPPWHKHGVEDHLETSF
eukprot:TRINITY_DN3435_c0_g1_i3.p1 TRINITY_DN3435_c0_g1~~TRINITY_DN3435_c0_g1_i3.p1  ORF type:complete len:413 (+),score=51.58 TRINITY_DN3435_c0_g1_i3:180-1418(+)